VNQHTKAIHFINKHPCSVSRTDHRSGHPTLCKAPLVHRLRRNAYLEPTAPGQAPREHKVATTGWMKEWRYQFLEATNMNFSGTVKDKLGWHLPPDSKPLSATKHYLPWCPQPLPSPLGTRSCRALARVWFQVE
jgi:hypothetical protein